ncbi:hypothetical protein BKA70DRAFT_1486502 [Coprinopsis sp. MPI-PUGE-AT-0042]|nr:hypothetical protein BKA70DRAFT_1486502 [Coprinopsis sp. MPI-PUGE-AT-0042]
MTPPLKRCNTGSSHPFVFGLAYPTGVGCIPRTLSELAMSQFALQLRREENWWTRCFDAQEQQAWASAAAKHQWYVKVPSGIISVYLEDTEIRRVLDELPKHAQRRDKRTSYQISCSSGMFESKDLVSHGIRDSMKAGIDLLERFPLWSPAAISGIDLVDPMLYSLTQRNFNSPANDHGSNLHSLHVYDYMKSNKYAMLPSDVKVDTEGIAHFTSYINNIHPELDAGLYAATSSLISSLLPMVESTLADLDQASRHPTRIPYQLAVKGSRRNLLGRNLQIITRIQTIKLTTSEPVYAGTDWHVEGMLNESIVACASHILESENLDEFAAFEFRKAVSHPTGFRPGDEAATFQTWGLRDGDPCHQYVGSVPLCENLSISFPNIYQYRLNPFGLANPLQEGRATIVTFLLVDPDAPPILSTANVPPQHPLWIRKALYDGLYQRLPTELIEVIYSKCDWLLSQAEAEKQRNEYQSILNQFTRRSNQYYHCIPFDIWAA